VCALTALLALRDIGKGEFFYNVDETQHAMGGLYAADFISDHAWTEPVRYTYRYYAQYQTFSPIIWPPLFYGVEGVLFLILGPSVVTARLAVLLFSLLAAVMWFVIVRETQEDFAACVSTALLVAMPSVLLFENLVMLEIPTLALSLVCVWLWMKYMREGSPRWLYLFGVAAGCALLCKNNSVYLAFFCLFSVIFSWRWKRLLNRHLPLALLLSAAIAGPFYVTTWLKARVTVQANFVAEFHDLSHPFSHVTYYFEVLPSQLDWPILILAVAGMVTAKYWADSQAATAMMAWMAGCYVTFTIIGQKNPRYVFYWIPVFLWFAVGPLFAPYPKKWMRWAGRAVAIALVIYTLNQARTFERPFVSGYAAAARRLVREPGNEVVLFDGDLPGNFSFHMRALDPQRRFIIHRKALYVTLVFKELKSEELIHSRAQIRKTLEDYGIRHIVVDWNRPPDYPIQTILRDYLETDEFRLLEEFPITSGETDLQGRTLRLYEYRNAGPRRAKELRLVMLTMDNDIVVPFDEIFGNRR